MRCYRFFSFQGSQLKNNNNDPPDINRTRNRDHNEISHFKENMKVLQENDKIMNLETN